MWDYVGASPTSHLVAKTFVTTFGNA